MIGLSWTVQYPDKQIWIRSGCIGGPTERALFVSWHIRIAQHRYNTLYFVIWYSLLKVLCFTRSHCFLCRSIIVLIYLYWSYQSLFSPTTKVGLLGMTFPSTYKLWLWSCVIDFELCSELLDPSFLFALDNGEKFSIQTMKFTTLLKITRVKVRMMFHMFFLYFGNYL